MITCLVDTDILVDFLRSYPQAVAWINQQTNLGISGIVWTELLQGAENSIEQRKIFRLLETFERVEIEDADVVLSVEPISFKLWLASLRCTACGVKLSPASSTLYTQHQTFQTYFRKFGNNPLLII
jgi:predicted nucleic acid-binding protein